MPVVHMPPLAGRRQWAGLTVLITACLFVSMDISVLFYAAPSLSRDLAPSAGQLLWILDAYGFLLAGLLVTMGVLGDRYGRRRMLMAGAAVFGGASVVAAFAPSAGTLIVCRAVMGIGAAMLAPSTLALISTMFRDRAQRRTAIGLWSAAFAAGAALGPLVGGLLLGHFWWGSVLLVNIAVVALLLGAGPWLLPESEDPAPGTVDLFGAVLSVAAILLVIHGAKRAATEGPDAWALTWLVAGLAVGAVFVRHQLRRARPLIDLALFRRRTFSTGILANGITQFALMGMTLLAAQYLQSVLGLSALAAALWMLPSVAGVIAGLALAGKAAGRLDPAVTVALGLGLAALGCAVISRTGDGPALLVTGATVTAVGVGTVALLATDIVLAAAPPERAGAASALAETSTELGAALGVAVLGTVSTALYQAGLPGSLPDSGTLAGALQEAHRQGPAVGAAVREAFTHGLRVTMVAMAALLGAAALTAFRVLRGIRLDNPPDDAAGPPG
ncbi:MULTISPECIES: MFS transporter [unclassified Streptomyces]|uniref:MFS transporter n=1 Tax=unclassified Streptomyces TaxID=2593676 RepID=UPI00081DA886|nr:MFS transporter [Streptomyces sp. ScaeMP-e83]SCD29898.1 MFS transporter, DHA2 family, multidrug resistance protein [Streptomyces sp. ScaeMP-e83]